MRTLFHQWLCPYSRKIRLGLAEKNIDFNLQIERSWEKREEFLLINPIGSIPVLVEEDSKAIIHHQAIVEYLEDSYLDIPLLSKDISQRAEVRRICGWMDELFYHDVWMKIVFEKVYKRHNGLGYTDSQVLRAGVKNLNYHMKKLEDIISLRNWFSGDLLSWADMTVGGFFSSLDYLGDIPWEKYPELKAWYARLKSRPCFRSVLSDKVPGISPSIHYNNLDF